MSFGYLYLPTIIAILYSILWSWIDLDTKRLEPFFQLSRPGGANAADSILLHYPFDFVAYAPIRALRRRHWAVVFAGTCMMLIFWGVTPLVSSVFARSNANLETSTKARTTAALMPFEDRRLAMNAGFMMTAYGIAWLGQAMPAFVTSQGFLEPFELDMQEEDLVNKTWKARTKLYGTSLKCEAANIQNQSSGLSYSNGKTCKTEPRSWHPIFLQGIIYSSVYIPYSLDGYFGLSLEDMGCPSPTNSHLFLGIWEASGSDSLEPNTTAIFCEPSYWTQDVNATVMIPSMNVSEMFALGPRLPLMDNIFNRTAFEHKIGGGESYVSQRADISETTGTIDQSLNLGKLGLFAGSMNGMVGFALGLGSRDLSGYTDPRILTASFEKAHKLLHALAMRQLMNSNLIDVDSRQGTVSGKVNAILVVRPLAIAVETLLAVVVILILALMFYSRTRISQLHRDPASLTDLIVMLSKQRNTDRLMFKTGQDMDSSQYALVKGIIHVRRSESDSDSPNANHLPGQTNIDEAPGISGSNKPLVRPLEMGMTVGIIFIVILLVALGTVLALKIYANQNNGLPLPSNKTLLNQLVLNYVLIPFEELRRANAKSSRSLNLKYTSLPPQLVLWRAFRAGHYLLGAVCAIGLSANLLAVSLSGLLEANASPLEKSCNFTCRYAPIFSRIPQTLGPEDTTYASDYQYIAKANISNGVSLPPWTSPETFFVPIDLNNSLGSDPVNQYRVTTQGFGVQPVCEPSKFNDTAFITGPSSLFNFTQRTSSGRDVTCVSETLPPAGGQSKSVVALEVFTQLQPIDDDDALNTAANDNDTARMERQLACNSILVAGFLRANLTVPYDAVKMESLDPHYDEYAVIRQVKLLSSVWMVCRLHILTAPYNLTVDQSGHVISFVATGPYAKNLSSFFPNGSQPISLTNASSFMFTGGADTDPYWHNDTFVDTWFAYFVKHLSNSTTFVDPAQPVPAFSDVVPHVENICIRLFAIMVDLNQHWLAEAMANSTVPGVIIIPSQRVYVSNSMFIITITLLTLNIGIAILYWTRRPRKMFPAMPYTIASILDMVHASGLAAEVGALQSWRKEWRFGYGKFVGTDGRPHVGIERRPFVVPIEA
ncbi:MAG: hypothetical protein Q9182_004466 [Xanthomendoza sp. 2 TL-2023]